MTKMITEHKTNDSGHHSNYRISPISENGNENNTF